MFRWLRRRWTSIRYQGHTAAEWYSYFRKPQYFQGDLANAITAALRDELASKNEPLGLEDPAFLSVLLTTDSREGVRCLAAIKIGLGMLTACENSLLAALQDESETVRRTAALALLYLNTVRGLAAVVAGSRHGRAVRTMAARMLTEHGVAASEAIPGLLLLLRDRDINWRSHVAAMEALTAIGEPALPWLCHFFDQGDPHQRYNVAVALKQMGKTPDLLPAIEETLARNHAGDGP